jgi:hypothetical protein
MEANSTMKSMKYKVIGKTCNGRTMGFFELSKLNCKGGGEGCPTVVEQDSQMLIVGRLLNEHEARSAGLHTHSGYTAVAIPRELMICAAQEISESARKIA